MCVVYVLVRSYTGGWVGLRFGSWLLVFGGSEGGSFKTTTTIASTATAERGECLKRNVKYGKRADGSVKKEFGMERIYVILPTLIDPIYLPTHTRAQTSREKLLHHGGAHAAGA